MRLRRAILRLINICLCYHKLGPNISPDLTSARRRYLLSGVLQTIFKITFGALDDPLPSESSSPLKIAAMHYLQSRIQEPID